MAAGRAARPLLGIQYLRAIGALLIVFFHMTIQIPQYRQYFSGFPLGKLNLANGVDLFFVVSGLIMMMSSRRATPGDFIVRRMIRIIPMYWLLTCLLALVAYRLPALFHNTTLTLPFFLNSLAFIPYANPAQNGQFFPLLVPGWSLNFEMFFYAVFACTLFLPYRARLATIGAAFGALLVIAPAIGSPTLSFFADLRLLEFWLGMAIASLFLDVELKVPPALAACIAAGGFVWLLLGLPPVAGGPKILFLLDSVLPAATVVFGVVALDLANRVERWAGFELLGDASYSIYLSHIFSLGIARAVWVKAGLARETPLAAAAFAILSCLLAVVVAVYVYRWVELPMLVRLQKAYQARRTRRLQAARA